MKILILTQNHPYENSGIVALDLYEGLKCIEGNEVKIVVSVWDKYADKNIIPIETNFHAYQHRIFNIPRRIFNKLVKIFFRHKINNDSQVKTNQDYCVQGVDQTITSFKTKKILKRAGFKPDAIIILFKPLYTSFKNQYELFKLTGASIFLYLMDMAPLTGGCHYAWDCLGYTKECGSCPALYSNNQNDQTHVNYMFKKRYIERANIFPVAATEWQFKQLNKSSLFKDKRKFKVLLSINENQYFPANKTKARHELGLPFDKKIIFFGAFYVDDKRKGFFYLIEALNYLVQKLKDTSMIHLAIAGNNNPDLKDSLPFTHTFLGCLNHNTLPTAFQSADVFVSPSIEDSGPMMVNQSIMCGTPVVAFEMGVALDLVHNGETGYRAKLKDSKDLADGIKKMLDLENSMYIKMSHNCREFGLKLCHPKEQAIKFMGLFKESLQSQNG
jgi:glycosyltransferase involved in cell wall biosynthesis